MSKKKIKFKIEVRFAGQVIREFEIAARSKGEAVKRIMGNAKKAGAAPALRKVIRLGDAS